MQSKTYLRAELLLLFVLIPLSFFWNYYIWFKVGLGAVGFVYVLILMKKAAILNLKLPHRESLIPFFKEIALKLIGIAIITSFYVSYVSPDKLFDVLLQKPLLWLVILFGYSLLSVWPQEVLYRTFFFNRYEALVVNKWGFIFLNAIVFSFAHLFLKNILVLALTFIGGVLFAYTYYTKRSTLLVSIEHAIYGNWLFTVGMGEMLAFPD
jgi:hypothetical protein